MKKLLYITDQQEYMDHGAIGPFFHHHLKAYLHINIVYFTKFKHGFQQKGDDFIVPEQYRNELCCYLESKGVDLKSYDYVFVRNMFDVLKLMQKKREAYGFKIGFRLSVSRMERIYELQKSQNKTGLMAEIKHQIQRRANTKLINACDLFLPNSMKMKEALYPGVKIKTHPLRPGLDPSRVQSYLHTSGEDISFIYVGTVDKVQRFDVLLDAFAALQATNWQLRISTFNPDYVRSLLAQYPTINERISVLHAEDYDQLFEQIHACDIGIALLPDLPSLSSTVPAKVMDYYTCAMPALMTDNARNRQLFEEGKTGFFCAYDTVAIAQKLLVLMHTPLHEIEKIGTAGQQQLLNMARNYAVGAEKLYATLETL
jgi:glycosyltransferase involved in cell wall biosynthesis